MWGPHQHGSAPAWQRLSKGKEGAMNSNPACEVETCRSPRSTIGACCRGFWPPSLPMPLTASIHQHFFCWHQLADKTLWLCKADCCLLAHPASPAYVI
jgi:hypothetical protein